MDNFSNGVLNTVFRRKTDVGGSAARVLSDEEPNETNLQTFSVELYAVLQTDFAALSWWTVSVDLVVLCSCSFLRILYTEQVEF